MIPAPEWHQSNKSMGRQAESDASLLHLDPMPSLQTRFHMTIANSVLVAEVEWRSTSLGVMQRKALLDRADLDNRVRTPIPFRADSSVGPGVVLILRCPNSFFITVLVHIIHAYRYLYYTYKQAVLQRLFWLLSLFSLHLIRYI